MNILNKITSVLAGVLGVVEQILPLIKELIIVVLRIINICTPNTDYTSKIDLVTKACDLAIEKFDVWIKNPLLIIGKK